MLKVAAVIGALSAVRALELHRRSAKGNHSAAQPMGVTPPDPLQSVTFPGFYDGHKTGRGIWKWKNALVAYQRHFGGLAGHKVNMAEIGVQSGGSLLMWRNTLGDACHVYGIDINPKCLQFQDSHTTITIGDQGSVDMWSKFFSVTCRSLDILIDDGGHQPNQMLVTLAQVFSKLNPAGFISIEDIHGQHYVESFFKPAATYLAQEAQKGQIASVHVYPFLLMVHKAGKSTDLPPQELVFPGSSANVEELAALWKELPKHRGGKVILANKSWGSFLTEDALTNFFTWFGGLHDSAWHDTPPGCAHTAAAVCTNTVQNSQQQALISGVHIYPTHLVVEVAAVEPVIEAVRRGTDFISYSE